MKQKQISQKLSLNKKTVANLGNNGMNGVKGGASYLRTCPYCDTDFTCQRSDCLICITDDDLTCLNTCFC